MLTLNFNHLDATEFEEFSYRLLVSLGFVNLDWRKGTGLKSSPADKGRDIVAYWERTDVDNSKHLDRWFVDSKHYVKGVSPEKLQSLLAWAEAERPRTALFILSNFLSNPAKDYLATYVRDRKPPFDIKYWERTDLERMLIDHQDLVAEYDLLGSSLRKEKEIVAAEEDFYDRIWYGRHKALEVGVEERRRGRPIDPEIWQGALAAAERIRETYNGEENLLPMNDFDWGMMSGKLSALRWVLGDDWDMLDT
jgi:hypothetical protein